MFNMIGENEMTHLDDFSNYLYEMFSDGGYMTRLDALQKGRETFGLTFAEAMQVVKAIYSEFDPSPRCR